MYQIIWTESPSELVFPVKKKELFNHFGFVEIWENGSINMQDLEEKNFI